MSEPAKKVTDARLSECLVKGGAICPFCGSDKAECLNSEHQDDVVIEKWACCTEGCPGNVRGWTQILSLSEIYVSEDDAAEGETGYSKPLPAPLPPEVKKLADVAEALLSAENGQDRSDALDALVDAEAAVRNLLPKETK